MKKLFMFFLLVALGFLSCNRTAKDGKIPITTNSESALALYKEAMAAFDNVNLALGLNRLKDARTNDPDFFMANYYLAMYYLGNKEKFNEYASASVNCKAKISEAEELLKSAIGKLIEKQDADVTDIGKKLVEMYPKDVNAYYHLYSYQSIIKDKNGRLATLKKALEITENPAPVYNLLGYSYMEIEQNNEAAAAFDRYIELAPGNPNVYDSKGDYYMNIKEYGKAYESYMKAYALDSLWSYEKAQKAKQLSDSLGVK